MRIGIVVPEFSADEQDWRSPVYLNLVRALATTHQVFVFPAYAPVSSVPYAVFGAEVAAIGAGEAAGHGDFRQKTRRLRLLQEAMEAVHQRQALDVIHAFGADEIGALAAWVGRRLGVPTVVSVTDGELVGWDDIGYGLQRHSRGRRVLRYALEMANAVIVSCEYSRQLALGQLTAAKVVLVPLGVDTRLFVPPVHDEQERPRDYVHVAPLVAVQEQALLLRLMAKLPAATLDVVGDGPLRVDLERLARELKIDDRVVFHGAVTYEELPRFYQAARFLLITARHEAFCMAAIEALACGTGVIGTAVGVLPEVGTTVRVGDIAALQRAIVSRPRKHRYIQRRRLRLLTEYSYSLEQMTQGFLAVYRQVTA